eukprot:gene3285-626_t
MSDLLWSLHTREIQEAFDAAQVSTTPIINFKDFCLRYANGTAFTEAMRRHNSVERHDDAEIDASMAWALGVPTGSWDGGNLALGSLLPGLGLSTGTDRVLVVGMGGGSDVLFSHAVSKLLGDMGWTALYANMHGPRDPKWLGEQVAPYVHRLPRHDVDITGMDAYKTTLIDQCLPEGPSQCPYTMHIMSRETSALRQPQPPVEDCTASNVASLVPSIQALDLAAIIGVDAGGDSLSGGVDWKHDPALGRDRQAMAVLSSTGLPFLHLVVGPTCDGETHYERMSECMCRVRDFGATKMWLPVEPLFSHLDPLLHQIEKSRTPHIVRSAWTGEMPSAEKTRGAEGAKVLALGEDAVEQSAGDFVTFSRGVCPVVPRQWLSHVLVCKWESSVESTLSGLIPEPDPGKGD